MWTGFAVFASIIMFAAWWDSKKGAHGSRLRDLLNPPSLEEQVASIDVGEKREFFRSLLRRVQFLTKTLVPAQALDDIRKRLMWAGNPRGFTPEEFYSAKLVAAAVVFGIVSAVGLVGSGAKSLMLGLGAGAIGYLFPDMWLNRLVSARKRKIESGLLSFADMLAVACEAGLPLKEAVERVSERYGGVLGEEFRRTFHEISLGRPTVEALEYLGEKNGVEELRFLTTALAQAEKHGSPMAQVLRAQVRDLRTGRRNHANEVASKASVKILIPTVLCMFLPMMVLLLGPAVVNLGSALGF